MMNLPVITLGSLQGITMGGPVVTIGSLPVITMGSFPTEMEVTVEVLGTGEALKPVGMTGELEVADQAGIIIKHYRT